MVLTGHSSGHLVLSNLGLAFVLMLKPFFFWTCEVYGPFEFWTSLATSILLVQKSNKMIEPRYVISSRYRNHVKGLQKDKCKQRESCKSQRYRSFLGSKLIQFASFTCRNCSVETSRSEFCRNDNTKTPPKTSITQRFWTVLGRSVAVTTATQMVWFNRFTGSQPSLYPN